MHVHINSWPLLGFRTVGTFATRQEFLDAVIASMAVPGFIAFPMRSTHAL